MAHHQPEEAHIGAAVSSSSSLESVNSADVDVSLATVEPLSILPPRTSLPNLVSGKALDDPVKEWQNIIQPLLTGEHDATSVPAFQAWLDLFTQASQANVPLSSQSRRRAQAFPVPPAPPLPIPIPRKTKAPSPPIPQRHAVHTHSNVDYTHSALGSSPKAASAFGGETFKAPSSSPPSVFHSSDRFRYYLEAPTSMMTPHGEDTLTYLNKGQFYGVVFEPKGNATAAAPGSPKRKVQSVISLVFREEQDAESELQHWEYWHTQQPNQLLRAFDVDRKCSTSNIETVDHIAHNATSFLWDPAQPARAALRMNCLSTEFSSQKGIRGMPLFLQIDTFDDLSSPEAEASHRCYCKIKIFRDKGAERKNKDENKSADRRMAKILKQQQHTRNRRGCSRPAPFPTSASCTSLVGSTVHEAEVDSGSRWLGGSSSATALPVASGFFQAQSKVTVFTTTSTLGRRPVFFTPGDVPATLTSPVNCVATPALPGAAAAAAAASTIPALYESPGATSAPPIRSLLHDIEARHSSHGHIDSAKEDLSNLDMGSPRTKTPRTDRRLPAVTVYVRKEEETVYNAIMMDQLTVQELSVKVGAKYDVPSSMIMNVYKRTKRGILVNLDDRMVQQFVNEDDFIIQLLYDVQHGHCDLCLHY